MGGVVVVVATVVAVRVVVAVVVVVVGAEDVLAVGPVAAFVAASCAGLRGMCLENDAACIPIRGRAGAPSEPCFHRATRRFVGGTLGH